MDVQLSPQILDDMTHSLQAALAKNGIINILQLAEEIRRRNEVENIALEDVAAKLMLKAQLFNAAMEFDSEADISPLAK
ncbi:MAG TPA: hypothetical protein VGM46_01265 [Mesorhizobium sp.]|jgi:hypothetical protein